MNKLKIKVITLIIVALIFGLGGLSFLAFFRTKDLLITNLEMHISSLTFSSSSEVGLWLKARQNEMEIMANTPLIENGEMNIIVPYLNKEIQRNKDFEGFFVTDGQGNYILNSGQVGNVADRDYFHNVMASGKTIVSDPLISRGSGDQIIVVAAPIINDNKVIGILGGEVNLTKLTRIVTSEKVGEIGDVFMVQNNGLIITHTNPKLSMKYNVLNEESATPAFKDAIRKMIQGETGVSKYSFQNEEFYLAFAPVPGAKWSLGVTVPVTYVTNQLSYLPIYFIVTTIILGFILVFLLTHWLVVPLTNLARFTTELIDKLDKNVEIYRFDSPVIEVQSLASNFHTMVRALQCSFQELESLNGNLENEIIERTMVQDDLEDSYDKLQSQEFALRESERRFRSLLENVELITGIISMEGQIIFINEFALRLTGFQRDEVIGKNYFKCFIPNEVRDAVYIQFKEALNSKEAMHHGTYPIITKFGEKRLVNWNNTLLFDADGKVTGFASIGEDITERKQFEKKLKFLSFHDSLTGLHNRTYFEEELQILEEESFNPVGLIICDVDGLKLVNDTLGHSTGDQLLQLTAGIIKQCFREEDLLFRIGGDEFAIILPKSELIIVEQACHRIRRGVENYNLKNAEFPLSLSVGFAVSGETNPNIRDVFKEADNSMYREKLHRSKSSRSALVKALMKALEARDFITEGHADRLQNIVVSLGEVLGLSERNLADLRLLAQFHDIGKVGIPDRILFKPGRLTNDESKEMQRHSEIGHRIAQSAPDLLPIADQILKHHEWWNGGGYPSGFKKDEIPLECRILAIADAYDAMTSDRPYRKAMSQEQAFKELLNNSGIQFDPKLVPIFIKVIGVDQKSICSAR